MLTAPPKRSNGFEVLHYRAGPPKKKCQRSPFFGVLVSHVKGINFLPAYVSFLLCQAMPPVCVFMSWQFFTPWKINGWNLQITHLERKMIFQTCRIMFHVNLQGCFMWNIRTPPTISLLKCHFRWILALRRCFFLTEALKNQLITPIHLTGIFKILLIYH